MKNFPSTDMALAACIGQHALFDSRNPADHVKAKALCSGCPAALQCWDVLQDVKKAPAHLGGSPEGTWAGQLVAPMRGGFGRAACGSEKAYQQHRHAGEVADTACLEAHAKVEQIRAARRKAEKAA